MCAGACVAAHWGQWVLGVETRRRWGDGTFHVQHAIKTGSMVHVGRRRKLHVGHVGIS